MSAAALPLFYADEPPPVDGGETAPRFLDFVHYVGLAPALMFAALLLGALDYTNDAFLALYGLRHGFTQPQALALLTALLAGYTLAHLPCGWLADRVDRQRLLTGMTALAAALYLAVPATIASAWLAWIVLFLTGCALSGIWTAGVVFLGQRFAGAELPNAYVASGIPLRHRHDRRSPAHRPDRRPGGHGRAAARAGRLLHRLPVDEIVPPERFGTLTLQ
jgi:Major Facilitator Superfamily